MTYFKAFLAGFLSTLVFHQGLLAILHAASATPGRSLRDAAAASTSPAGPSVLLVP
jgi:hypothetical protein